MVWIIRLWTRSVSGSENHTRILHSRALIAATQRSSITSSSFDLISSSKFDQRCLVALKSFRDFTIATDRNMNEISQFTTRFLALFCCQKILPCLLFQLWGLLFKSIPNVTVFFYLKFIVIFFGTIIFSFVISLIIFSIEPIFEYFKTLVVCYRCRRPINKFI